MKTLSSPQTEIEVFFSEESELNFLLPNLLSLLGTPEPWYTLPELHDAWRPKGSWTLRTGELIPPWRVSTQRPRSEVNLLGPRLTPSGGKRFGRDV